MQASGFRDQPARSSVTPVGTAVAVGQLRGFDNSGLYEVPLVVQDRPRSIKLGIRLWPEKRPLMSVHTVII